MSRTWTFKIMQKFQVYVRAQKSFYFQTQLISWYEVVLIVWLILEFKNKQNVVPFNKIKKKHNKNN